jgi:putative transposase
LPDVFSTKQERKAEEKESLKAELYQQIGQLKVELDWFKKKLDCSTDHKRQMIEPERSDQHPSSMRADRAFSLQLLL